MHALNSGVTEQVHEEQVDRRERVMVLQYRYVNAQVLQVVIFFRKGNSLSLAELLVLKQSYIRLDGRTCSNSFWY
jgi:hypothetical protein